MKTVDPSSHGSISTLIAFFLLISGRLFAGSTQTWGIAPSPGSGGSVLAASADGIRLVAAGFNNHLYLSSNAGMTWTQAAVPINNWSAIVMSADGTIATASGDKGSFISTNAGLLWTTLTNAPGKIQAGSADGAQLFASGDGLLYFSRDTGSTWTQTSAPINYWTALACSANGSNVVASASADFGDGLIYVSTNGGLTWQRSSAPPNNWTSVASSANGGKLVAAEYYSPGQNGISFNVGKIYTSSDSGKSWVPAKLATTGWNSVAISADGTTLFAASLGSGNYFNSDGSVSYSKDGGVYCSLDGGLTWAQTGLPEGAWEQVKCSADGSRGVAASRDGQILTSPYYGNWRQMVSPFEALTVFANSSGGANLHVTSVGENGHIFINATTNAGTNWIQYATPFLATNDFCSIASSCNGVNLLATTQGGLAFSHDSGSTWTTWNTSNICNWYSPASSEDGKVMAAVGSMCETLSGHADSLIYVSTNAGLAWTQSPAPNRIWRTLVISSDGSTLLAGGLPLFTWVPDPIPGPLYLSTNSGTSWRELDVSDSWSCVAVSASGQTLVAAGDDWANGNDGLVWTSRDHGETWGAAALSPNVWGQVAISTDGSILAARTSAGLTFVSRDFGVTWAPVNSPAVDYNPPTGIYGSPASIPNSTLSGNNPNLYTVISGQIWRLDLTAPTVLFTPASEPALSIGQRGTKEVLSWLVPSQPFALQETISLIAPIWLDVTNQPSFNLSNLNNEVVVPAPSSVGFFRLRNQQ